MPKDIFAKILEHQFEKSKGIKKEIKKGDGILANIFSFEDTNSLVNLALTSKPIKNLVETKEAPVLQLFVHDRVISKAPFFKDETRKSLNEVKKFGGGLTNDMFKFKSPSHNDYFMARRAGKGTDQVIDRKDECGNIPIMAEVGVGAEVVYADPKTGNQIMRFHENLGTLSPGDIIAHPHFLKEAVDIVKKLNEHPKLLKGEFKVFDRCRKAIAKISEAKKVLPENYQRCQKEIAKIEELMNTFDDVKKVPCHNDANPYNFLKLTTGKLKLIDGEYAGNGDAMAELANFYNELMPAEIALKDSDLVKKLKVLEPQILELYGVTNEFDYQRYVVWKAVGNYWWALWAQQRLVSETEEDKIKVLEKVGQLIYYCEEFINSREYHEAFDALTRIGKRMTLG